MMEDEAIRRIRIAAYNQGLDAAISVLRAGIHSAVSQAGLWGIQDDDAYFIAAIAKMKRPIE